MGAVPDTVANCAELILGVVSVGLVSVLFVSVCVSDVPTTVPEGAVLVAHVSKSASQACTSMPIAIPKAARAVEAVVEPVPPLAIATVPVMLAALPLMFPDTLEPANEVIQAGSA